jgi:hypothetical protein
MKLHAKSSDFKSFKNLPLFIFKVVLPSIIFLIVVKSLFGLKGVPFSSLVVDPNAFKNVPPYIGMISMLGILLWCASSAISLFVACILPKNNQLKAQKWAQFLLFSGCLTMLLVLDDLFQIHEYYYRIFIDLALVENPKIIANIFEGLFFIVYAILILVFLYRFKLLLKKTNYKIFLLSLLFFAISIVVDLLIPDSMPLSYFLEEGSKFVGIVIWFGYFFDCCYQLVQKFFLNQNYLLSDRYN